MNPGIYAISGGQSATVRRLAGQAGRAYAFSATLFALGCVPASPSLTAGVRTRIVAINGRGALRAVGAGNNTGGAVNMRLEVWIDGTLVVDTGTQSVGNGNSIVAVGAPYAGSGAPLWDWVPFDASIEVWVTAASTSASYTSGYVADIHQ